MCGQRKVQTFLCFASIMLALISLLSLGWTGMGRAAVGRLPIGVSYSGAKQAGHASHAKSKQSELGSKRPVVSTIEPNPAVCTPLSECIVTVKGSWVEAGQRGKLNLAVLVRPLPDASDQAYWVQAKPRIDKKGNWSSDVVYIGQPGDWKGMPFKVCAVATTETLPMGLQVDKPPDGPISCIDVKRGHP